MDRREIIDSLVFSAARLFGDERDRTSPLAEGLGDQPLADAISFENFIWLSSFFAASAYRRKLESLSDDALFHELEAAVTLLQKVSTALEEHNFFNETRRGEEEAEKVAADQQAAQERLKEFFRQSGRKGGTKSKRAEGIVAACRELNKRRPGITTKEAWRDLLANPYTTSDGRYTVTAAQAGTEKARLVQSGGNKVVSINYNTFRQTYWSPPDK